MQYNNSKLKIKEKSQKGSVALFSAIMIMTLSLTMVFSLSVIFLRKVRIIRGLGDSVVAFYAANTGIEKLLYEDKICNISPCPGHCIVDCTGINFPFTSTGTLINGAFFEANYSVEVGTGRSIFESVGEYRGARRAIRVRR